MEFVLWLIGKMERNKVETNLTRIQKTVYLINKYLESKAPQNLQYSFEEFYPHAGPNDPVLRSDLGDWAFAGLIQDTGSPYRLERHKESKYFETRHIQLTGLGQLYYKPATRLAASLGGKEKLDEIGKEVDGLCKLTEAELVDKASIIWEHDNQEDADIVKKWMEPQQ